MQYRAIIGIYVYFDQLQVLVCDSYIYSKLINKKGVQIRFRKILQNPGLCMVNNLISHHCDFNPCCVTLRVFLGNQ